MSNKKGIKVFFKRRKLARSDTHLEVIYRENAGYNHLTFGSYKECNDDFEIEEGIEEPINTNHVKSMPFLYKTEEHTAQEEVEKARFQYSIPTQVRTITHDKAHINSNGSAYRMQRIFQRIKRPFQHITRKFRVNTESACSEIKDVAKQLYVQNIPQEDHLQIRKKVLKTKLQYAAQEFGRVSTKSNQVVPKEQQVSLNIGNKMILNHKTQQLIRIPLTSKSILCMEEIGSKNKKLYDNYETITKYFSPQEQKEHTRIPKLAQDGELKLHNKNNSLYDTGDGTKSSDPYGRVMYAITLDGKIITHPEIQPGIGIEYCYLHSTLLGGGPGICFGTIKVLHGKIGYISNHSGHYNPTEENLYNAIKKLEGLFIKNALVVFHCPSFDESGNPKTNEEKTKVLFTKRWCTVEEFLEAIENSVLIARGEQDKLIKPEKYFKSIRDYNESYRDLLIRTSYKPVPVFNGNIQIAVEHSIRKIIGAGFGHKPILSFDRKTFNITVSFYDENDALKFYVIFQKYDKNQNSILKLKDSIYVERYNMYKFLQEVLQISKEDIIMLVKVLIPKDTSETIINDIDKIAEVAFANNTHNRNRFCGQSYR